MNKIDWRLTWQADATKLEVGQAEIFLSNQASAYRRVDNHECLTLAPGDKIAIRFFGQFCDVAEIGDPSQVHTLSANIIPLFARCTLTVVAISPMPEKLFAPGETLLFDPPSLLTKLTGRWYPFLSQFANVQTLRASTDYLVGREGLVKHRDRIRYIPNSSVTEIAAYVESLFDRICSESPRILVPLSSGYDSRLILACAKHYCDKTGKELAVLHSVRSKKQLEIVQRLCELLDVRPQLVGSQQWRVEDKDFARLVPEYGKFASGPFQRPGFLSWYRLLETELQHHGPQQILGFATESHRGQTYDFCQTKDALFHEMIGVDSLEASTHAVASHLGLEYTPKLQFHPFWDSVISDSRMFPRWTQRTEYIRHHLYICNRVHERAGILNQAFEVVTPFQDEQFLSMAFSLEAKNKYKSRLVVDLINSFCPKISGLEFISSYSKNYLAPHQRLARSPLFYPAYKRWNKLRGSGLSKAVRVPKERAWQASTREKFESYAQTDFEKRVLKTALDSLPPINPEIAAMVFLWSVRAREQYGIHVDVSTPMNVAEL